MISVVDASVGVKWLFPDEERADRAFDLYDATLDGSLRLYVPRLFKIEVTNVVRRKMLREGLSFERALEALDELAELRVTESEPDALHRLALSAAHRLGLPAIYDAHYVALAEAADCELWTDDRRLVDRIGGRLPHLRWLGEGP